MIYFAVTGHYLVEFYFQKIYMIQITNKDCRLYKNIEVWDIATYKI
jgi:hypothetical protein